MRTKTIIPKSWNLVKLSTITNNVMYGMNAAATEYDGINRYIRITDIDETTGQYLPNPISTPKGGVSIEYKVNEGDILFARTGASTGKSYLYRKDDGKLFFAGFLIRFHICGANPTYVYYQTLLPLYKKWVSSISIRSGQPGINAEQYKELEILLPPLPEQQKIVEVLEAWDSYLEKLTNAIKCKKKIKIGLMEKLLIGKVFLSADATQNKKTRYFRIPKHWKIVSIGEVANEVSKKNTYNINLPVLSCTKHAGLVDSLKFFKKQIFSKKLNTYKVVDMGQFAYATNHIEEGSIGLQNLYDSGLVSPMYTVFKTNKQKILNDYLFPLLKTVLFRHIFKAKTSSSVNRRGSLRWKSFSKIEIPLPPMEDQEKIANILTTADQDIEALEKKKSLIEQQKKFLLNNLITGKIRLPEFIH